MIKSKKETIDANQLSLTKPYHKQFVYLFVVKTFCDRFLAHFDIFKKYTVIIDILNHFKSSGQNLTKPKCVGYSTKVKVSCRNHRS